MWLAAPSRLPEEPERLPEVGPRVRQYDRIVDARGHVWMPIFTTGRWGWVAQLAQPLRGEDVRYVPKQYAGLCRSVNTAKTLVEREGGLLSTFNFLALHARELLRNGFRRLRLRRLLLHGLRYRDGSRWLYADFFLHQLRLDKIVDHHEIDPSARDRPFRFRLRRRRHGGAPPVRDA